MATKAQKIRLALFFIVSCTVMGLFFVIVAGSHLLSQRDMYYIEFADVTISGLNKGASVKYMGFNIGRVEDISISTLDLTKVIVEISIERRQAENAIRTDTEARMASLGITGLKYIELFAGSNSAEPLASGSTIIASETFFNNLQERAEILSSKIEVSIDNLNALISKENRRSFTNLLNNTSALMATANTMVQSNQESVDETATNVAAATRSFAEASASLAVTADTLQNLFTNQRLDQTLTDLQVTIYQLRHQMEGPIPMLVARIDTMVGNIDQTFIGIDQTVGASRQNLLHAMQDLEETLQNVRETTEIIRDNPAILIRGSTSGTNQ